MKSTSPVPSKDAPIEFRPSGGLRLRLWLACLGGALVAAGGIWLVIGTQLAAEPTPDLALGVSWLAAVAGLGVIAGAGFALWVDHGIVTHARGLAQSVAARQIARMRGLPSSSGWGELSLLTLQVQQLLTQFRQAERATEDLGMVRDQLNVLHQTLNRWNETERWSGLRIEKGPTAPVAESIDRGLRRLDEVRDQNHEAARQIAVELERALTEARQSSEQSERGFVEATALLTTIRELQRLHAELVQLLGAEDAAAPGPVAVEPAAEIAREAIEELVAGSTQSVERLARGLQRVEAIADQVTVLANRATLVALDSSLSGRVLDPADQVEQARTLVGEIRATVDHTARLASELQDEVSGATSHMRTVREKVALKLDRISSTPLPPRSSEEMSHLLERVREMVQDATRKGERLSAVGERSSRAAEALLRHLEAETREMEGLLVRMAPVETEPRQGPPRPVPPAPAGPGGLRLLSQDDLLADDGDQVRGSGAGEEPR